MCPRSFRTVCGCPLAGATQSVRPCANAALRTIKDTMYIVPSCGSGNPSTSPNYCEQMPFTGVVKLALTRATPCDV